MSLSSENNIDLGYDTEVLRQSAKVYGEKAQLIRGLRSDMITCLNNLTDSEWTTKAGKAFSAMVDSNWSENMRVYAGLLDTLETALNESADSYDELTTEYIEKTKLE